MASTKKATEVEVGDVFLVHYSTIGSMSLTTGEFKAGGNSGVHEHQVTRIEQTAEEGWNDEVTVWGPQPGIRFWYVEHEATKWEREKWSDFGLDDDVTVKQVG